MIFERIIALLDTAGVPYTLLEHDHVHSSADAAKVRGTRLEEAAKALVLEARRDGDSFVFMCVVSGHLRLDLKAIKSIVGTRNASLAHPEAVLHATGCKVGTVPPLPKLLGLPGYADEAIFNHEHVVFSAGSHHKSIRMKAADWFRVSGCDRAAISRS